MEDPRAVQMTEETHQAPECTETDKQTKDMIVMVKTDCQVDRTWSDQRDKLVDFNYQLDTVQRQLGKSSQVRAYPDQTDLWACLGDCLDRLVQMGRATLTSFHGLASWAE